MLSQDRLTLAIDIHSQSYKLLRWVADAIGKGFIPEHVLTSTQIWAMRPLIGLTNTT